MVTARTLGPGGLPLTRLGLGLAALGRPGYITLGHAGDLVLGTTREDMRDEAHAVLDAAVAHGVRYVDVARSYGAAEEFLRSWLDTRRVTRGGVTVGSKWGYVYEANWQVHAAVHERKEHSADMLRRQFAESTAILGEHLALYQIHSVTPESRVLSDAQVLDELARVRERGIRVGLTVSGASQAQVVREAMLVVRDGVPLFTSIQATWNLLERSCERALGEAHDAGFVVIVKEALANGRLVRGEEAARGPLAELAAGRGLGADTVALAATLAQPWADVVLLGASDVRQLTSNLRAVDVILSPDDLDRLSPMRVSANTYWQARARLPWN